MTKHMTGTRKDWLAARIELLKAEKEHTRRGDELARRRQELPWVRIEKTYRFETDEGSASLADLFRGRSQLLIYHFMFGPDYAAGCATCSRTASSTTPTPPMRADWTASGACTSGSTALPGGATKRMCGGSATTSTPSAERRRGCRGATAETGDLATHGFRACVAASFLRRLRATLRGQRRGDDRLVRAHVGDGRDADARRLDDVDGVDADARKDVDRRRGVVPRHVGRDDGGDDAAILDANAVALPPGHWQDRRDAARWGDRAGRRGVLLRVDRVRNGRLSAGHRSGDGRDAAAGAGARRTHRGRFGRPDRRLPPAHRVEGASPCLVPGGTRARAYAVGRRRHGLATRPAPRPPLHPLLCRSHGDPPGHRGHRSSRDGCRGGSHHRRTSRSGR